MYFQFKCCMPEETYDNQWNMNFEERFSSALTDWPISRGGASRELQLRVRKYIVENNSDDEEEEVHHDRVRDVEDILQDPTEQESADTSQAENEDSLPHELAEIREESVMNEESDSVVVEERQSSPTCAQSENGMSECRDEMPQVSNSTDCPSQSTVTSGTTPPPPIHTPSPPTCSCVQHQLPVPCFGHSQRTSSPHSCHCFNHSPHCCSYPVPNCSHPLAGQSITTPSDRVEHPPPITRQSSSCSNSRCSCCRDTESPRPPVSEPHCHRNSQVSHNRRGTRSSQNRVSSNSPPPAYNEPPPAYSLFPPPIELPGVFTIRPARTSRSISTRHRRQERHSEWVSRRPSSRAAFHRY